MTGSTSGILVLAFISIVGIGGMLVAESAWDWLLFALASLPLLLAAAMVAWRSGKDPRTGRRPAPSRSKAQDPS